MAGPTFPHHSMQWSHAIHTCTHLIIAGSTHLKRPSPRESERETEREMGISIANPNPSFVMAEKRSEGTHWLPEERRKVAAEEEGEEAWLRKGRAGGGVMLEGYVEAAEGGGQQGSDGGYGGAVGRTKSLTDDDLEELKGCLDLGFGFSYDEIPELCNTLPALELCYSMSQRFLDDQQQSRSHEVAGVVAEPVFSAPIANWRISGPGDHPDEVKARLKYWAQAVACTVRLCS